MFERNKLGFWTRMLLSIVLLAVLVGGGYAVYRMGFSQGAIAADAGDLSISDWYGRPFVGHGHYYPFGFFSLGRLFFGFFFLMLVFGLFRRIIFGPRWARWGHGWGPRPGKWGYKYGPRGYRGHHGHNWHPWYPWDGEGDSEESADDASEEEKSA